MQAIILSGGKGTRLHPLTLDTPKPMLPINGVPHLEYQIRLLKKHGITDIIFSTGYLHEKIEEYFGNGENFGVRIQYKEDGVIPLGTAGALRNCLDISDSEELLVMNGDVLTDMDLSSLISTHMKYKMPITMSLVEVDDPTGFGIVQYSATSGRVTGFIEKPSDDSSYGNTINAGIYCINRNLLYSIEDKTYIMLEHDIFPRYAQAGMIHAHICSHSRTNWLDIGTHVRFMQAQKLKLS
ncbi:nucleotidyltransferase family protein [Paenibacillus illinoisensis]|uniref:nucleotidyltransferase family protein n=1 Tax=Paenibacillus illinoisensis TaxID=59845 RepID=UPI003019A487